MKTHSVIKTHKPNIMLFINTEFWCLPFGLYIHKFGSDRVSARTLSFHLLCFEIDVYWVCANRK